MCACIRIFTYVTCACVYTRVYVWPSVRKRVCISGFPLDVISSLETFYTRVYLIYIYAEKSTAAITIICRLLNYYNTRSRAQKIHCALRNTYLCALKKAFTCAVQYYYDSNATYTYLSTRRLNKLIKIARLWETEFFVFFDTTLVYSNW